MATNGEVQAARYEFKYLVNECVAEQIRRFVLSYLEPDAHTAGREGIGYPVHSLYLDSPSLQLCRATQDGLKNRFKLRVRFYGSRASHVFFEIKRRVNDVILKERAAVKAASVERLILGQPPRPMDLVSCDEKSRLALHNFCWLRDELGATPSAYTSYAREGYEPRGSNVCRVTFDRALRAGEFHGRLSVEDLESWARPEVHGVVLELKFTDAFPIWMQTMVESFNLLRCSMPKYVKCVSLVRSMRHEPGFLRALNQGMDSGGAEKLLQRTARPAIGPIDAQMIA